MNGTKESKNMKIENNAKFLIIGDSIGDFGRARPVGEGLHAGLGTGFPRLLDSILRLDAPEKRIRVVNMCNSGDTSRDLLARFQSDVLDLAPDYLCVEIGINDVWRHFDEPYRGETFISREEYGANLRKMASLAKVKGLFFISPFLMEPNTSDPFRAMMDEYGAEMRRVAESVGGVFIDIQKEMDAYFKNFHPVSMSWDHVHPDPTGHLLIARAVARAMEI